MLWWPLLDVSTSVGGYPRSHVWGVGIHTYPPTSTLWYTCLCPLVYPPCSLVYLAPATSLAGGNNGCYVTVTVNPSSAGTINVWRFKCHRYICNSYFIYTSGAIGRNSCCSCIETRDTNKEIFNLQMGMLLLLLWKTSLCVTLYILN